MEIELSPDQFNILYDRIESKNLSPEQLKVVLDVFAKVFSSLETQVEVIQAEANAKINKEWLDKKLSYYLWVDSDYGGYVVKYGTNNYDELQFRYNDYLTICVEKGWGLKATRGGDDNLTF